MVWQYKLTKVITIAPRYLVKNSLTYGLKIRQHNTQNSIEVAPGQRVPVHELQHRAPAQLSIAFDESNPKW
jgi:vacuolar protein sorting-associated protein 13A/C